MPPEEGFPLISSWLDRLNGLGRMFQCTRSLDSFESGIGNVISVTDANH